MRKTIMRRTMYLAMLVILAAAPLVVAEALNLPGHNNPPAARPW